MESKTDLVDLFFARARTSGDEVYEAAAAEIVRLRGLLFAKLMSDDDWHELEAYRERL